MAWVGFYSSDLNTPILGYQKQSQFAMGGLLGYNFGPLVLQGWLTSNVYEKNYGGTFTVPAGSPFLANDIFTLSNRNIQMVKVGINFRAGIEPLSFK